MLWYGIFNNKNSILNDTKVNQKLTKSLNKYNFSSKKNKKKKNYKFLYYVPHTCNFVYLHNFTNFVSYFYIFSTTYFFKIPLTPANIKSLPTFDLNSRVISLSTTYINSYLNLYTSSINQFFNLLIKPFFRKITFKGKGYYLYKSFRNTITPQFGYSHRLYIYTFFSYLTFLSKTSLILFGLNIKDIEKLSYKVYSLRPVNIFTGRGVRFSKQIIYKKSGKVSTYR
jgi:ribosomal protein L6P/L9E